MAQKLVIEWKLEKINVHPFVESFFCKDENRAQEIVNGANKENIKAAYFLSGGKRIEMNYESTS